MFALARRSIPAALVSLALFVPAFASAASAADTITTLDSSVVSRGEFLRAAVQVLGVPVDRVQETQHTYDRPVPHAYVPYVRAAEKRGAMDMYGSDLGLGRGITRGEALIILTKLQNLKPSGSAMRFTDVDDTEQLNAVRVAIEKDWMQPLRSSLFGVRRMLTGSEARLVLRKVAGESNATVETDGTTTVPSIVIKFQKREVPQLPESDMLRAVWQLLGEKYLYTEKIDGEEAAYEAAEAMVKSLKDPYTVFMRPSNARFFQEQLGSEVSGIGAQVEYRDEKLFIVAPLSGSPAERAGLLPGDEIIAVDGEKLEGMTFVEAVERVRGAKGSIAKLTVRRSGNEFTVNVTRDTVRLPEIDISFQNNVAIVKIVQFGQTTDTQLRSLMLTVQEQNPKGIVIDLRNNPGGLLHAADVVASNFLPQGSTVAVIKSKDEEYSEVTADPPTIDENVPVVVLVNGGSASASEIVAAALQDHKRATILGQKTFGKGTVQQIVEFRDGSSLKMTIAEWMSPKRHKIDGIGVSPDITVAPSDARDEQLLRAIDMLR